MEVICLQEPAFYELLEKVYERLKDQHNIKQDKWISGEEAMRMLRIKSPSTLQDMRDKGAIRYSQPSKKLILYDAESIQEYLNEHSRETF
ncbi:MAG: helix-turn-helix domain-containing protein [Mucilaginibacter sp.]